MNTQNNLNTNPNMTSSKEQTAGKIMAGMIVVTVGTLLLIHQLGIDTPEWLFTWQMLIVAIGFFNGAKHSFRNWSWLLIVGVGLVFLADEFVTGFSAHQYWPILVIIAGICIMFDRSKNRC